MLCSECNKNNAIIFIDKVENGQSHMEGLCFDCAKKRGINPDETLKNQAKALAQNGNIENMTKQFEGMFQDLTKSLKPEDIENIEKVISQEMNQNEFDENFDEDIDGQNGPQIFGAAIPLGSIFSNMFNANSSSKKEDNKGNVKVDTKKQIKLKRKNI